MEFDRQRAHWRGIVFYIIYLMVVVYLLMTSNPLLYSHLELRQALAGEQVDIVAPVPRPEHQKPSPGKGEATFWQRSTPERTGHDTTNVSREKDYLPEWQKILLQDAEDHDIQRYAIDESGLYLTGNSPWVLAYSSEGDLKWRFRFDRSSQDTKSLWSPMLDQGLVYLSTPEGQVVALDKTTGQLQWKLLLAREIVASPLIFNDEIIFAVRPLEDEVRRLESKTDNKNSTNRKPPVPASHRLVRIRKATGELKGYSETFVVKSQAGLTWARDIKQILITSDNKIHAISTEDFKVLSTQTLPDPIEGEAVFADGRVFVALLSGKIQAWDLSKKGRFEWEVDLSSPPLSPPTYIPSFQQLSVITADSQLHMIDLKKAKHLWLFPIENRNPSQEIWTFRLHGRLMEKFAMKWVHKGWTAWAPCSDGRICIYNPEKGQLIARIMAAGGVVTPPLFIGKGFYLISSEKLGQGRKRYRLTHYVDEETARKKIKNTHEAATAAQGEHF